MSTTDVTISSEDIAALADIGHDTLKSIVALVVEATVAFRPQVRSSGALRVTYLQVRLT